MYYFSQSLLLRFCLHLWSLAILLSWGLLWFSLCLPCLWFFELVEAMDLQFSLNLCDFQQYYVNYIFCSCHSPSVSWFSNHMYFRPFDFASHITEVYAFFSGSFSLCFNLDSFLLLFNFTEYFLLQYLVCWQYLVCC